MGQHLDRTSIIEGESPQKTHSGVLEQDNLARIYVGVRVLYLTDDGGSNQTGITEEESTKQTCSGVLEQDNLARMYVGVICTLESYILHLKDDRRLKSNDI